MIRIIGTVYEGVRNFMVLSGWVLLIMINISGKPCRENQNIFYVQNLLPKSCRLCVRVE